jgi:uncharacterized protein
MKGMKMRRRHLSSILCRFGVAVVSAMSLDTAGLEGTCQAAEAAAQEWHVAPKATASEREVRFANGDASLVGTLFLPQGDSKYPVVVATHGAEAPTRKFALYRQLASALPTLGYGVFIYDRRGSGASTGDRQQADLTLLADDAIAAARAVAADAHVDARRIGYWGLSQGGWLAVLAVTRDAQAAFAISVSAPLTTPGEQMHFAMNNLLAVRGYTKVDVEAQSRTRRLLDDYYLHGKVDQKTAQRGVDAVANRPWFKEAYLPREVGGHPEQSRWRKELGYDPVPPLLAARVPVLLIFGGADPWIPVRRSLELLRPIMSSQRPITVRLIANADHVMRIPEREVMTVDDASIMYIEPSAPDYFLTLGAWLGGLGLAPPR